MKKIGNVQTVSLHFRPSVYVFDEIKHQLIFNRIIDHSEIQKVIGELGKEVSLIQQVRRLAAQTGKEEAKRDLAMVNDLVADLSDLYTKWELYATEIKNGSGKMRVRGTEIHFVKPRVVEFPNDKE